MKRGAARASSAVLVAMGSIVAATTVWIGLNEGVLLTPSAGLLVAIAGAVVVYGSLSHTAFGTSVSWSALSLVGFCLALQLVDAGGAVAYPHLRPAVLPLTRSDALLIGAMVLHGILAAAGAWTHLPALRRWISREVGPSRLLIFVGAVFVLAASPMRDIRGFGLELILSTMITGAALLTFGLAIAALPRESSSRLADMAARLTGPKRDRGLDPVAMGAAGFAVALCALLARFVYEGHPHISDEFGFLFQALYFAGGDLAAPGVPVPDLFDSYQIECSVERCLSVLQPGWPALLAVGVKLGAPWLVNPVLAGVNVLLLFSFVREVYGAGIARLSAVLLASSPWFLFLGMSLMNHQATLTFALVGVLGTTLAIRRASPQWAALAGAGVGLTSLMRPMDGVIAAVVAGIPLLLSGPMRRRLLGSALFAIGVLALGSTNLMYNAAVTGDPLDFPVTSYVNELWGEGSNNLGFGPDRGVYPEWAHMDAFPGHSPFQAVVNAGLNLTALQVDLFGWAIGSLTPLLLFLLWGRLRRADWWMLLSICVIVALYSLYWFASGPDFAARYWFLAVVPIVVLTARALTSCADRLSPDARPWLVPAVALLVLQGLVVFVPWRSTDKYYRYIGTGPMVAEMLESGTWPDDVFVVQGASHPDFAGAMIYRAPDLAGAGPVFVYDTGSDVGARTRAAFPGRKVWRVEGPGRTGDVYRILGPLR